jgi:hypothetical protein
VFWGTPFFKGYILVFWGITTTPVTTTSWTGGEFQVMDHYLLDYISERTSTTGQYISCIGINNIISLIEVYISTDYGNSFPNNYSYPDTSNNNTIQVSYYANLIGFGGTTSIQSSSAFTTRPRMLSSVSCTATLVFFMSQLI